MGATRSDGVGGLEIFRFALNHAHQHANRGPERGVTCDGLERPALPARGAGEAGRRGVTPTGPVR